MNRHVERFYPPFAGLVAGGVFAWAFWSRALPPTMGQAFSTSIDLGAITVGFLATAKTVLLSIQTSRAVQQLKSAGVYDIVVRYLVRAIQAAFLLAALSMAGIFFEPMLQAPDLAKARLVGASVWVAVLVGTAASCYRIIQLFFRILSMP